MATRRLYYDDSFLENFEARLLSCDQTLPSQAAQAPAPSWEAILDRTAFYPASGGQPHDTGKLGDANVLEVREEDNGEIVHIVDDPLEIGEVKGCVNWPRRFDHMQQHTGQHLLSGMFQERFGLPTVSFHLGGEICTIDLQGPEPTDAILEGAERAANQVIFQNRPVTVRYGTAEQFAELGVRKEVDRPGILRAIEIEGADLQPCGGTHVKSTGQIGAILVRRCSKIRQDWRVEFVCGRRAERVARQDFLLLRGVAERLQCAHDDVVFAADRMINERDAQFKAAQTYLHRLAAAEAALLLQATDRDADGVRRIARVFHEDVDTEYLGQFAARLAKAENTITVLARIPCGHLIFAQHPSAGKDMNALLQRVLQQFGGKGGGTRDFARGKLADAGHAERAIEMAKAGL